MDIKTFYEVLEKAMVYTQSYKGRALKAEDRGMNNNQYEIPVHLPISVSHILTLMLYCNFTELQCKYKKEGCREANKNETIAEFIKRNQEIGHWYKLLSEAIRFYGTKVKHGQVFYTGINIPVSFDTYTPRFMCPFSTTIDWNVANRFANSEGNGIILRLEPQPSSFDRYFNVEWISNYKEERERLFCKAARLQITDIQYSIKYEVQYNNWYLSAFRLWSSIFAGHYFILGQSNRKATERTLIHLILNYNANNGITNGVNARHIEIPIYIQQLFYHLVHQLCQERFIRVITSEYLLLKESLQNELLSHQPLTLYPFLLSLNITPSRIHCLEQYIWILSEQQLETLKYGQKDIFVMSGQEHHYKMKNKNN
eukprot:535372_1